MRSQLGAAFAVVLFLSPIVAQANCIATSLTALAVVQAGDAITTSGPVTRHFPGGFVTQDHTSGCIAPGRAPAPGGKCTVYEADPIARRSGCVNSFPSDLACATVINLGLREAEFMALRHARPATVKTICFLNYAGAFFYAAFVWPNNLRADYALAKASKAPLTVPKLHLTLWKSRF